MSRVYDAKPRPRVLIEGFDDDEAQRIAAQVPTAAIVTSWNAIYVPEWDLLVTRYSLSRGLSPKLFVLGFGLDDYGVPDEAKAYQGSPIPTPYVGFVTATRARELQLGPTMPPGVELAVRSSLLAQARQQDEHMVLETKYVTELADRAITPFLQTTSGHILAGSFRRANSSAQAWCLPPYADVGLWLRTAMNEWRSYDPDRFPQPWTTSERWLTSDESRIVERIRSVAAARAQALAAFDAQEVSLEAERAEVHGRAALQAGRLITAQGDALVDAVAAALTDFGLDVESMDDKWPSGDRREDLRVRSSEAPGWLAIVEVRGYVGGATVSDLLRLQRFAERYHRDQPGAVPVSCWYVCNQFLGRDPAERPVMLHSNADEVGAFRESRPLALIDTAALFLRHKEVSLGTLAADAVRSELVGLNGVLSP